MLKSGQRNDVSSALGVMAGSVLDAVVAVDGAGDIVEWNDAAERTFGWTRAEVIGRSMGEIIVPVQHRQSHYQGMRRYQHTGDARVVNRRIEISAIDKGGREFPVELSIVPVPSSDGTLFVGFIRDISERRIAAERLMLSEESLRLTTEAGEIGVWDWDLQSRTLTWSSRTKAMFGISPDAACSIDDFYAGLHPEDREAITLAFSSALDPSVRSTYDVQYRTIGKEDGVLRWVAAKGKGLFDQDGRCYRAVGTAMDITARKLADARHAFMLQLSDVLRSGDPDVALGEACALTGHYFGVGRVGYGHLDLDDNRFDYATCWTDGMTAPQVGRYPVETFGALIAAKLARGEAVTVDDLRSDPLSDAQSKRYADLADVRSILLAPLIRNGHLRTIVYLHDQHVRRWRPDEVAFMTEVAERMRHTIERSEAEAALRTLNATLEARVEERTAELRATEEALRQAQKMEAIGQLTGGIAHDFNNLLQGIIGGLELIKLRVAQGRLGDLERLAQGAMASASRAAALTHRLLAFARRQPLDPHPVRANPLVLSMDDLLRRTLGELIELKMTLANGLWLTRCDPNQLESAILNLAINARDAMPEGGRLTIETCNVGLDGVSAERRRDIKLGEYVCISVTDTGIGMSPETAARAFDPFFTTKPIGQGTGLGLSMIYGFAQQSEGYAKIRSELGSGTTLKLYLPRYRGDAEQADEPIYPGVTPAAAGGQTVLVVEDEPAVRSLVVEVLGDLGYQSIEATDGPGGVELLQSGRSIDLLITDVGLPGLNGRQVADAGRTVRPGLRVLFMTGYAESIAMSDGFLEPGMTLITKPFALDDLMAKVRAILETV